MPKLPASLAAFIASGKPTLVTDGLAKRLEGKVDLGAANVHVLAVHGQSEVAAGAAAGDLDAIRSPMLEPLGRAVRGAEPGRASTCSTTGAG